MVKARPIALYLQRLAVERRWRSDGPAAAYQTADASGDVEKKRKALEDLESELFFRAVKRRLGTEAFELALSESRERASEIVM